MPNFTEPDVLARERTTGREPTVLDVRSPEVSKSAHAAELLQARGFDARALNGSYPAWLALNPGADGDKSE